MPKEPISDVPRRRLHTDTLLARVPRDIAAISVKLQPMLTRQRRDELLVRLRLRPAQLVIKMNNRRDNPQLAPQLEQQPQQCNRIIPPETAAPTRSPAFSSSCRRTWFSTLSANGCTRTWYNLLRAVPCGGNGVESGQSHIGRFTCYAPCGFGRSRCRVASHSATIHAAPTAVRLYALAPQAQCACG